MPPWIRRLRPALPWPCRGAVQSVSSVSIQCASQSSQSVSVGWREEAPRASQPSQQHNREPSRIDPIIHPTTHHHHHPPPTTTTTRRRQNGSFGASCCSFADVVSRYFLPPQPLSPIPLPLDRSKFIPSSSRVPPLSLPVPSHLPQQPNHGHSIHPIPAPAPLPLSAAHNRQAPSQKGTRQQLHHPPLSSRYHSNSALEPPLTRTLSFCSSRSRHHHRRRSLCLPQPPPTTSTTTTTTGRRLCRLPLLRPATLRLRPQPGESVVDTPPLFHRLDGQLHPRGGR